MAAWAPSGHPQIQNFYADLYDVKLSENGNKQSGYMRIWFAMPDKYRFEIRPERSMRQAPTKILNGEQGGSSTRALPPPNSRVPPMACARSPSCGATGTA